jgi:hypothetical protein
MPRVPDDSVAVMHPDVEALKGAIHSLDDRVTDLRVAIDVMSDNNSHGKLSAAIVSALRQAADDPAIATALYNGVAGHARRSLAQYVGERVLAALAVLVLSAAAAWAIVTGQFKA